MLLSMAKVQIIGPKKYFYRLLSLLHKTGTIHIDDVSKKITPGELFFRRMEPGTEREEQRKQLENLLVKVGGILSALEVSESKGISTEERNRYYDEIWLKDPGELDQAVNKITEELEEKTRGLATRKSDLELELASLSRYENIVEKIRPVAKQLVALEGFETIALLIEKKYKVVLGVIREEVAQITKNQFELVAADVDEATTAALLIVNKNYSEAVHSFLWAEKVNEVRLPEEIAKEPFDVALQKLKEKKARVPQELTRVKEELRDLSQQWYARVLAVRDLLRDRIEELQVASQTGETDYTFVVEGWTPRRSLKKAKKILEEEFGERVVLVETKVGPEELEEAPIMYENPSWARPFEMVMKVFSPPRYGTIDPTPFLALFFPIFFGLIVGDMGYGLVILLAALYLRWKYRSPLIKNITAIFIMAGASTIFFGFLYAEFFGDWLEIWHLVIPVEIFGVGLPFERLRQMMPLLYLTLAIGTAHIVLGLILGAVNALREHAKKHLYEKVGMLVVLLAIFFFVAATATRTQLFQYPGVVALMVGVVLLLRGAGFMGVMEIFGVIGNIFSYARIMALGLASVILAMVANKLAGSMGNIIIGITIASLLHVLNIAVGAFSPSIHSLRLNFIEFFSKFYEPGGKPYKPFKRTGGE